jgi:anionic cell wall polymer biosynthesis LytR-Cps2A-Psr (LCP) family protein
LLKAVVLKMLTPDGIERLPEITNRLLGYVLTDLSPADISQMICLASKIENKDEIIFETVISDAEQEQAGQWVMDEFQGFQVFALMVDKNMLTERLADFQAGIFP